MNLKDFVVYYNPVYNYFYIDVKLYNVVSIKGIINHPFYNNYISDLNKMI